MTRLLVGRHHCATQTQDTTLRLDEVDVVLFLENCRWFPTIMRQLSARSGPPLAVVWHWEPLLMPKTAGLPLPSLSLRERAKIVFRDVRATDAYTNLSHLLQLSRRGFPDLLIVSSQAWQESLAEHGVAAHWLPYGYERGDGAPIPGPRDIDALFLGALEIPRRKRLIKRLRRSGIDLIAKGSWLDEACWGEDRTRLINRAEAFINLQRYRGELSAHRLILGMANKSLVVSEPIYRPAPFVPGEHYVEADVDEMPATLSYYRAHPAERDRIVERAHRFVTEELTMDAAVARIISLVGEHTAARDERRG